MNKPIHPKGKSRAEREGEREREGENKREEGMGERQETLSQFFSLICFVPFVPPFVASVVNYCNQRLL
ncbi:MAG: hypothetical protein CFE21_09155 [Bacteroidetes bacterium B1(2017)]|nr:MAG: hypothetical protein CFE21_09155 [Bacteroidetes bacterium B1(2017)]